MTIKELSNLYYLNREIERQMQRLVELESLAIYKDRKVAGLPKSNRLSDTTASFACDMADLREIIRANLAKVLPERNRLERCINQICCSDIREIFRLRHVNGLTWEQIGYETGYTESGVRKKYNRHIKKVSEISELKTDIV